MEDLVYHDDVLGLRTQLDNVDRSHSPHTFINLLEHALRSRAWYCAHYLLSVINPHDIRFDVNGRLLWSAIHSYEPKMFDLAYSDPSALDWIGNSGETISVYLATSAQNVAVAYALRDKWIESRHVLGETPKSQLGMFYHSATLQAAYANRVFSIDEICERTITFRRRRNSDIELVRQAIVKNDWLLIEHMVIHHRANVERALKGERHPRGERWFLFQAASSNSSQALMTLLEFIDLDQPDPNGDTMMHWATRCGNISTVEALLAAGANPAPLNHKGQSPIVQSLQHVRPSIKCIALIAEQLSDEEMVELGHQWWFRWTNYTLGHLLYDPSEFAGESAWGSRNR